MPTKKNLKVKFNTKTIVLIGMLTALNIVLTRFLSFSVWNMKIGLGFVPIVIAAMLLGPVQAGIVGALGDLIGTLAFPIGPYFPAFTLTAFLAGLVFGVFLYRKRTLARVFAAVGINQIILSQVVNTYWISVLYGSPYGGLFATRIVQTAILIPVQIAVILALEKVFTKAFFKKAIA